MRDVADGCYTLLVKKIARMCCEYQKTSQLLRAAQKNVRSFFKYSGFEATKEN